MTSNNPPRSFEKSLIAPPLLIGGHISVRQHYSFVRVEQWVSPLVGFLRQLHNARVKAAGSSKLREQPKGQTRDLQGLAILLVLGPFCPPVPYQCGTESRPPTTAVWGQIRATMVRKFLIDERNKLSSLSTSPAGQCIRRPKLRPPWLHTEGPSSGKPSSQAPRREGEDYWQFQAQGIA